MKNQKHKIKTPLVGSPLVSTPNFTSIYSAKDDMGFKLPKLNFSTQNVSYIFTKITPYDDI